MAKKVYDDKMRLEMSFAEAMGRYAQADPQEMRRNIEKAKKKRPPGGKKKPSGGTAQNVVSLRSRRKDRGP